MNVVFLILLIILIIAIVIVLSILIIKLENENKINTIQTIQDVLDNAGFYPIEIHFVNKKMTLALNKGQNKLAVIENFNPNNPSYYNYREIALSFIEKIEKGVVSKIYYIKKGEIQPLSIYPVNKEILNFIHKIFKLSLIKRIETKFPQIRFSNFTSSDWACSYFWAFSKYDSSFAYLKTIGKIEIGKINLKKEHFTLDTKYNYFEAPIFGIAQQLFVYDKDFLNDLWQIMLNMVKDKYSQIIPNSIYFDVYNNIVYLTNGFSSFQSVVIDKIEDVQYRDNRISFDLFGENRVINYISNQQQISDFENFVIDYNLKKIAHGFDNKTDKVINTTLYTKLILDYSRNRIIYCANLNKFSSFNYLVIPFEDLKNIQVEKSGLKSFIRITTKNKEIIDITCDKKEVAQYIEALVLKSV